MSDESIIATARRAWSKDCNISNPRIEPPSYDMTKFTDQATTDIPGVEVEHVDQSCGVCGDDFYGRLAAKVSNGFYVVDFST